MATTTRSRGLELDPGPGGPTVDAFVRAHYDRSIRLARLVCVDPADAGDAVQAALERAWRSRSSLEDSDRPEASLDGIVVREAIRADRRRRSATRLSLGSPRVIHADIADHAVHSATSTVLGASFDRLSAAQRAAVALHHYKGYSVAETAELTGSRVGTTQSRLRAGSERLRRALEDRAT